MQTGLTTLQLKTVEFGANIDLGMKIVTLPRCGYCGRKTNEYSGLVVKDNNFKLVEVNAPWCRPLCLPLTKQERSDPEIKTWWTTRDLYRMHKFDPGIVNLVQECHNNNIPTLFSCSGHIVRPGYIDFYDWEDLEKARTLLGPLELQAITRPVRLLGELHRLYIPKHRIINAKRKKL